MIFHELATNANKHGALMSMSGAVEVLWDIRSDGEGHALAVQWRGHGAVVRKPRHKGFGLRLISKCCRVHESTWTSLRPASFAAFWLRSVQHRHCEIGASVSQDGPSLLEPRLTSQPNV